MAVLNFDIKYFGEQVRHTDVTGKEIVSVFPKECEVMQEVASYYSHLSIRPGYLSLYNLPPKSDSSNSNNPLKPFTVIKKGSDNEVVRINNSTGGIISNRAKRKINNAIDWLLEVSPKKLCHHPIKKYKFWFRLNFITLTLPAKQFHDDLTIKNKCLNQFLTELRQQHKIKFYVWGAESQRNGNIHFHITTNVYIHWSVIRKIWNRCVAKLGYLEAYRNEQIEWHKYGFRPRPELFENHSEESQRKAYENGMKGNWSDPNSTDIKSVRKIKSIARYLSKHYSKQQDKGLYAAVKKGNNGFEPCYNPSELPDDFEFPLDGYRVVAGDLWGISHALSKLVASKIPITPELLQEIIVIIKHFTKSVFSYDYNMNIYVPIWKWSKLVGNLLRSAFNSYKRQILAVV